MTLNEKEPILYMAMRLVNELLDADEPDFVDDVLAAIVNADFIALQHMLYDLYGEVIDDD